MDLELRKRIVNAWCGAWLYGAKTWTWRKIAGGTWKRSKCEFWRKMLARNLLDTENFKSASVRLYPGRKNSTRQYTSKKAQVVRSHTARWWPTTHNTGGQNWRKERKRTQEATDERRHHGKENYVITKRTDEDRTRWIARRQQQKVDACKKPASE